MQRHKSEKQTQPYFDGEGHFVGPLFQNRFVPLTNRIHLYPYIHLCGLVEVTICLSKKKHQQSVNVTEALGTVPWFSYLFWIGQFILVKTKIMHFLCFYNESFSVYGAGFFFASFCKKEILRWKNGNETGWRLASEHFFFVWYPWISQTLCRERGERWIKRE